MIFGATCGLCMLIFKVRAPPVGRLARHFAASASPVSRHAASVGVTWARSWLWGRALLVVGHRAALGWSRLSSGNAWAALRTFHWILVATCGLYILIFKVCAPPECRMPRHFAVSAPSPASDSVWRVLARLGRGRGGVELARLSRLSAIVQKRGGPCWALGMLGPPQGFFIGFWGQHAGFPH